MQGDLVPRHSVETIHYELVFRLKDRQGSAFAFECDERGHVYLGRLPRIARHSLKLCLQGEVDGFRVRPGVVQPSTRSFITPGSGRCSCGQRVVLTSDWANACETCGREYDGGGVELDDDPERYG